MKYAIEWFSLESRTTTKELNAETLEKAKIIFNDECLILRMSSENDQKKYIILLSQTDENDVYGELDSFSV